MRLAPVLVVAVVLHTAVLPQLRVAGVGADLLLLVGVAAGLAGGSSRGVVVGFLAGLLADCFLSTPFGLSALCGGLVGFGAGAHAETVVRAAAWIPAATAAVASASGVALFAALGTVLGERGLVDRRLVTVAVVVGVANGLLLPLVLPPVRWATRPRDDSGLVLR